MKRFTQIWPLLVLAVALTSCTKKPTAAFSVSPQSPLINEEVKFNNSSQEGVTYAWDFGDGTSSEEQSPEHAYAAEGNYRVKLTTYSKGRKKWAETLVDVTVQHPTALFTGKLNGVEQKIYNGVNGDALDYNVAQVILSGNKERIYDAAVGKFGAGQVHAGIKLGTLIVPSTYTLADMHPGFHDMIQVAYYPFSTGAATGMVVYYQDASGILWSSDAGTADQTGSTIVITYTKDDTNGSEVLERFKAHVNCNLYNGLGGTMTLTDGIFELAFGNI